jgi:hypothetical protein
VSIPPLLEAQVVVGAHTREHRDLLAAKAHHPSNSADPDADILRPHQLTPCPEVVAERILLIHRATVARLHLAWLSL